MPLLSVEEIAPGVRLGRWEIVETVDEFLAHNPGLRFLESGLRHYGSVRRQLEILAVHSLLYELQGAYEKLSHDDDGKPCLASGVEVSVSHTKGCAAVIVSSQGRVAVDVEYMSDRVGHVAQRLLRLDESATTLHELMLHWCAKETLYKLYSDEHLALKDMRILSIEGLDSEGTIKIKNVQRGETLDVHYRVSNGFVLTYAVL